VLGLGVGLGASL